MINTLYLPELREMLADQNTNGLREFCDAIHPARTAEFMEGLTADECWRVLKNTHSSTRVEIFSYFDRDVQHEILEFQDRDEIADLIAELAPDDRVDILDGIESGIVDDLLARLPTDDRRDSLRLRQYPAGTAGAVMTTDFAKLEESLTVNEALSEIGRQAEELETIYYLYIVDNDDHLRGLVSARQLVASMTRPETRLAELMETELISASAMEDQEEVANKVAQLDLLAIPVVDQAYKMLGIITHDDIIDVVREEATEDAHRIGAIDPLDESYLRTRIRTLCWKRGIWLGVLFIFALITAIALDVYDERLKAWAWLVPFIPLVISSGGNSGSQSATLIITALSQGHITLQDSLTVIWREFLMGMILGTGLAVLGFAVALMMHSEPIECLVLPITLLLVVLSGTLSGSLLPLLFKRIGLDPAMMSTPFVAGIIDILGILIYLNVGLLIL